MVTTAPLTVIALPFGVPPLPTPPAPEVTCAFTVPFPLTMTGRAKVTTTVWSPVAPPVRHSMPGAGGFKSMLNVPAELWVLRDTILVGTGTGIGLEGSGQT